VVGRGGDGVYGGAAARDVFDAGDELELAGNTGRSER
jgi:hypothetical protein